MTTTDPLALTDLVQERYRRYLKTTFYFRDPVLRASFERALEKDALAKGPYLEATPVFKPASTARAMFTRLLGYAPDAKFLDAIQGESRALYQHQARAIERVFAGHNVIVATGTGSGKTESFLFPILLHLYQEFRAGTLDRAGVRALILYPMNALANDQRERLGEIAAQLEKTNSPFRFTYGQYIGETPEDERVKLRANPPHILLTNYSMLEYLLLRPNDTPLFDDGRAWAWKFLVLDEAHQYRGARGIEMAMLVRRLKQRLREGGRDGEFRCIATSASLVNDDKDAPAVALFAKNLFGEEFIADDLIRGDTVPIADTGQVSLNADDYGLLAQWSAGDTQEIERLFEIGARLGMPYDATRDAATMLGAWLERDARATQLRQRATAQPVEIEILASDLFPGLPTEMQRTALTNLIELLIRAHSPATNSNLLSARYHLFLRALEGAYVTYLPKKEIFLDRRARTANGAVFEVALCRECGQHYFVGKIAGDKFLEAVRDPSQDAFGADYLRPWDKDEETDEVESEDKKPKPPELYWLCLECGSIAPKELRCGHTNVMRVVKEKAPSDEDRKDQMAKCGACGYGAAGRDPVREVIYGADGPHAVIATTLFQTLPKERRKVLAFADGRQEAAYFAWYLEDSYRDLLNRNLLLQAIQQASAHTNEGLSLRDVANHLREPYRERKIVSASMSDLDLRREAWLTLYREFLTDETRISLEGVGLLRWTIQFPDWMEIPRVLLEPPWSMNEQQARDLLLLLLETMRADRGIDLRTDAGVALDWSDIGAQISPRQFVIGPPNKGYAISSWDGKETRRVHLLAKLLGRKGFSKEDARQRAQETLRAIWKTLTDSDRNAPSDADQLLVQANVGRWLNPNWYRVVPVADTLLYRCDTCKRLSSVAVENVCPRKNCQGTLEPLYARELEANHYRLLYTDTFPGAMRVEEHTAQLDKEKARTFQREFREGKIDVLSCSTTFELGVDLGNLDTIFLRNVPPETFNYVQRVGRAGRRRDFPGLALTYCRRAPHDLYHFANPQGMMRGKINPPVLVIQNEKIITRHLTAVALSSFFRAHKERFSSVTNLIGDWQQPRAVADIKQYLTTQRAALEISLRAIVPDTNDTHRKVGLNDGQWIERVAGTYAGLSGVEESRLVIAQDEAVMDYKNVESVKETAKQNDDPRTWEWARLRANTIAEENVLSFLSRKVVIPKYGFPVDVVELDTQQTQRSEAATVSLQRDLAIAISEFAPTSELVANKKLWKSYALKRVAEKEWERRWYKRCTKHNIYVEWKEGESELAVACGDPARKHEYIIPKFGFTTNREPPKAPSRRPARVFTTRPYFAHSLGAYPDVVHFPANVPLLSLYKASPASMTVLCEGKRGGGFFICRVCGAGFRKAEKGHENAFGKMCHGELHRVALGHNFITDVVRVQFHLKPTANDPLWLTYGLAFALVEAAAETLDVPATDLNATVSHNELMQIQPIVLYDNVPGGAGLVARLHEESVLRDCLQTAHKRVNGGCGCDAETSCYGCLRSYRNQFAHQNLQRGPVKEYLEMILAAWS